MFAIFHIPRPTAEKRRHIANGDKEVVYRHASGSTGLPCEPSAPTGRIPAGTSIAKQIGNFGEERAIGPYQVGGEEPLITLIQRVIVSIENQVALLVAVVVTDVEHRAGIHAVGKQHIRPQLPAERVVFRDVAQNILMLMENMEQSLPMFH